MNDIFDKFVHLIHLYAFMYIYMYVNGTCEVSALCDMLFDEITYGQRLILLFVMSTHVRIRNRLQVFGKGNC